VHHQTAKDYADQAGGHIYEVEPTGVFKHDYSSGDFKSDHPLRVLRVANDWPTAKDIEAEGSRRTGALANPVESKHPHEWFHGSPHAFGEFYDTGSNGDDEDTRNHWNVMLGNHFTATHNVAHDFSLGLHHHVGDDNDDREEPLGHVIHARLNIKNPKVYGSEHEMDQEAYEHEHAAGNHIDKHLGDKPGDDSSDEEWDDWHDNAGPEKYYAGDSKEKYTADTPDPQVAYGFHPKATGWLNNHPDKEGIAARFKKRLMAAGHDGIVYGNEFERADAGGKETSAIAFHPHQIDITQHHYGKRSRCLTPEECERTGWSGQEMVPGTENLQRRADKSAGSRLTLPLPGDAWRRWLEDFFRRNRRSSPAESWQMGDDPAAPATPADGTGDSSGMSSTASWDDDDDDEPSYHCPACGEGHEDEETRDQHMGAWTDWDKQYPHLNDTIHRGMMAHLPEHVADVVHDESRPMHERAGALAEHVRREGDLGMHWTDQLQGTDKFSGGEASHSKFPVIVHAHKPERHHIEEDPDTLNDHDVINYHDHDEYEVPMRLGAPVKVKGISWRKPGGYNTEWQHHDFKEPMGMTAMTRKMAAWDDPEPNWDEMNDEDGSYAEHRRNKANEWDDIHSGLTEMHRGINVHLRPEDHAIVHDHSLPVHQRAEHLLKALPHSSLARGREDLGRHWTDNLGVGESFGEMDEREDHQGRKPTSVVFHAHAPQRHDIDEEPDQRDGDVYGYHDHGEREIPMRPGGSVHLKGISWKPTHHTDLPEDDFLTFNGGGLYDHLADYTHHDFGEHGRFHHARVKRSAMWITAHDSGDGQRIFHCPFCGAGQVIARSDGTVECEFCHTAFTVQVQPQFSSFPQTDPVTGQPIMIPGMPGQIDAPGTLPGAPGELPPGAEDDGSGNPFDDGSGGESGPPGAEESDDSGGDDNKPDFLKGSSFRTAAGDLLTEEAYTRHLALRFSANPEKMIATLRSSR
jgi:hypothetical protein